MSFFQISPAELSALRLSISVALWALGVSLVPGVLCGWLLARKDFRGKSLVDAVLHLPLVVPPVVTGYVLLRLFGSRGLLGRYALLGDHLEAGEDVGVVRRVVGVPVSLPVGFHACGVTVRTHYRTPQRATRRGRGDNISCARAMVVDP